MTTTPPVSTPEPVATYPLRGRRQKVASRAGRAGAAQMNAHRPGPLVTPRPAHGDRARCTCGGLVAGCGRVPGCRTCAAFRPTRPCLRHAGRLRRRRAAGPDVAHPGPGTRHRRGRARPPARPRRPDRDLVGADHDCLSARALVRGVPDLADRDVYLCASPRMSDAVRMSLREAGLPAEFLHEERFAF
jgi:hypothetical protein